MFEGGGYGESGVYYVGKLNKYIYNCIIHDAITDDVIITDERILHIKERHPGDYERFIEFLPVIIDDPDYIVSAGKPNTAVLLKEIEENGEKFKVILRLRVETDPDNYKNSVLSFWHIGEITWRKNLNDKKILYKRIN